MKIVTKDRFTEKDKEKFIRGYKVLASIGTTGKNKIYAYPLIEQRLESIYTKLEEIAEDMELL